MNGNAWAAFIILGLLLIGVPIVNRLKNRGSDDR
jgi:hypothetical protein